MAGGDDRRGEGGDQRAQAFGDQDGVGGVGVGQDDGQFVGAEAGGAVDGAQVGAQQLGDGAQDGVGGRLPVLGGDGVAKSVDLQAQQRQGATVTAAPPDLLGQQALHLLLVEEPGQLV